VVGQEAQIVDLENSLLFFFSRIWLWGKREVTPSFSADQRVGDMTAPSRECLPEDCIVKPGTFDRAQLYMPESQKLCLKCVGNIQSICFNAHTTIDSVSAGADFCMSEDD
jgi:hypothetical protein